MPERKTVRKPTRLKKTAPVSEPNAEEINRVLDPVRAARRAREAFSVPVPIAPPHTSPDTLKPVLEKAGIKLAGLEQLAKRQRAEVRRLADKRMRLGIAQSKSLQAFLDHGMEARKRVATDLSGLLPATRFQIIDRPAGISTSGGLNLDHARIQSMASWAKVRHHLESNDSVPRELALSYFWQNPSTDADMVITADSYITVNGIARADDTTGFWIETHLHTTLDIGVEFLAYDWPITSVQDPHASSGYWSLAHLDAYGPGWPQSVGAIVIQNVFRGFDVRIEDLIVKAGMAKVLDLVLRITANIDDGDIDVDLSSNNFQVTSPMALIRITSQS